MLNLHGHCGADIIVLDNANVEKYDDRDDALFGLNQQLW
jgi:hypothetical protein